MKKFRTLLQAPVMVQSGYGVHSRQIFRALASDPMFDLYIESTPWGMCSHITTESPEKEQIRNCIHKRRLDIQQGNQHYDIFIQVSVANEFEKKGTFNVGVTAGIEVDRVAPSWIVKANEMDLLIVPSEHSKEVFKRTSVEWHNPQTNERGVMSLNTPIEVCHEGVDTSIFHSWRNFSHQPKNKISELEFDTNFNFLHIGQWAKGGFGEDRKNIANLVKYFIEEFRGRKDVGLVLKIGMAKNSIMDYEITKARLNEIKSNYKPEEVPSIYLLHGNLTDHEMASLYNHRQIKAFVSLTAGEGFGIPLLEAAACDLPVLATNWSGHLDFLKLGKFGAIKYELKPVPQNIVWKDVIEEGSQWAVADELDARERMRKLVSGYDKPQEWAEDLGKKVRTTFDIFAVNETFVSVIKRHLLETKMNQISPLEHLRSLVDTPDDFNVVYTMPMSTGDVFISTAVIDGLVKKLPEGAKIYFATQPQYAALLEGNPNIHKVIPWSDNMIHVDLMESVFDLVLTPNVATQYTFSNWVRNGSGRLLAQEFAAHCNTDLGDYYNPTEKVKGLPELYMTLHTTSGKGQWEGRNYRDWKEILHNLKLLYPDLKIVQVGGTDEPLTEYVDLDLRGKTNYKELAHVLDNSLLHLSPDTFTMHLAASLHTPLVALFGCSIASATGPWVKDLKKARYILMQSERLSGCREKPCYKNRCKANPQDGASPINEIDAFEVFQACAKLLQEQNDEQA